MILMMMIVVVEVMGMILSLGVFGGVKRIEVGDRIYSNNETTF